MTVVGTACALAAVLLVASPALAAAEPTLADIAGCNEQAASRTGASALPQQPGSRPSIAPRADAARPSIVPGPADRGVGAPSPPPQSAPPHSAPGEKSDATGSVITQTPDPLVRGMDAEKADDPQYRAAYRECMRARIGER